MGLMIALSDAPPPAPARRAGFSPGFGARLVGALALAVWIAYGALAALAVQAAGGPERYVRQADFVIVLTGAAILAEGHPAQLYDAPTQERTQAALLREVGRGALRLLPFNHPPFEALLAAALRALGLAYPAIFVAWTGLSLAAAGGSVAALRRGWPLPGVAATVAPPAALTYYPLFVGLLLGQSSALVWLGWAGGSAALRRGQDGWAGAALALAALKPQTLPVILLALLVSGRGRAPAACLGVLALVVGVTLPVLGGDWPVRYAAFALAVAPDPAVDPTIMPNWRGLFLWLCGPGPLAVALWALATGLSLAVVIAVWWRARRAGPGAATPEAGWDRRWAVTLLLGLLVSPHLLAHDLVLALVPGWMLAQRAAREGNARLAGWLGLGWALGFVAAPLGWPLPPAATWLALTAGWLAWEEFRLAGQPHPVDGTLARREREPGARFAKSVAHPMG